MNIKRSFAILFFLGVLSFIYADSRSALDLYNKGYENQTKGNYYSAIENYREALEVNPKYADAWYNMALSTFYLGEYDLAMEYAQEAEKYSRNYSASEIFPRER